MHKSTQKFIITVLAIMIAIATFVAGIAFITDGFDWWTIRYLIIIVPATYFTYEWYERLQND